VALSSADYDASYFATVYGSASKTGEPQQTRIDRARDRLLVSIARTSLNRPLSQASVVDVGCGYGWLLDTFASAKTLAGSDISEHAISMASRRHPDRDYRQADLLDGPPFEGTFDVVLAVNLIEHLTNPAKGVESISALCTEGSVVLVHLPVIDNAWGSGSTPRRTPRTPPTSTGQPVAKFEACSNHWASPRCARATCPTGFRGLPVTFGYTRPTSRLFASDQIARSLTRLPRTIPLRDPRFAPPRGEGLR